MKSVSCIEQNTDPRFYKMGFGEGQGEGSGGKSWKTDLFCCCAKPTNCKTLILI
jgi:hypothetical protein